MIHFNYPLSIIHYLPIGSFLSHIIVPLFRREIALHVLTQTLGNLRQRDQILRDGTVLLARPDVVLVGIEHEIGEPTVRLEQQDGFNLLIVGIPEE